MLTRTALLVVMLAQLFTVRAQGAGHEPDWLPTGVHAESAGQRMRINGLPTDVLRLHGAANIQQLRDAFLSQDATYALPSAQIDGWELHARPVAGGMQTLQLRTGARGEVEAIFAITDLSRGAARTPDNAPLRLSGDAQITSIVESTQDDLRGTQYVGWSRLSPVQLRQRLCSRARAQNWQVRDCDAAVIDLSRADSALTLTVVAATARDGSRTGFRSVVVMNHLQRDP